MKQNDFAGAVILLTDPALAEKTAARVASGYFPDSPYHFTVTDATPTSLPETTQTRISTLQRGLDFDTVVLTVYPWAATESILPERSTSGQIPS